MKKNEKIAFVVVLIIAALFLENNNMLSLTNTTGFIVVPMNMGMKITEGQTTPTSFYMGNGYTFSLISTPDITGVATVAFFKNGVKIGGDKIVPTTDCPPDCNYEAYQYWIDDNAKGATMCFTDTNNNYRPYCYSWMLFNIQSAPIKCTAPSNSNPTSLAGNQYLPGVNIYITDGCDGSSANYHAYTCTEQGTWSAVGVCMHAGTPLECNAGTQCELRNSCNLASAPNGIGIEECHSGTWTCIDSSLPNQCSINKDDDDWGSGGVGNLILIILVIFGIGLVIVGGVLK